jgi:NADPH:quinone reductase-like Zn-dependent oxidoreductase
MKAIRYDRYGSADVLELREVSMPVVGDDDVLVRVRAASVNPLDFHFMRGTPYLVRALAGLRRPKFHGLGADMAGQVEAVGKNVTEFNEGDEVLGSGRGMFAEYVCVRRDAAMVAKPSGVTFEQAACVPVAALTALQALRKGGVTAGQRVLVNGASGGVGTFAVQMAKALGAEVTGVCSTGNVGMVRSIGVDHVVDYTSEDFTQTAQRYDVMVDMAGPRTLSELQRVLAPKGVLVAVGGAITGDWIAPLLGTAKLLVQSLFVSQTFVSMLTKVNIDDLARARDLLQNGMVTAIIDRTYPLSEAPEAVRYLEQGHAKGKVVITM